MTGSTPGRSEDRRRLVANWTIIPSDVPPPVRTSMNRVNGRDYSGSTTCDPNVPSSTDTLTQRIGNGVTTVGGSEA